MEFIDLKIQYQRIQAGLQKRFETIFQHGKYILGPEVYELEQALAKFVGAKHCITLANGTDALLLAMMALGIGAGDEVITPAFSFIATAEMIAILGAKPIFIDIDPHTYNLDASQLAAAITPKTKAIIPVDLFGQCADYEAIFAIAQAHHIPVIEDAAQSFGAIYGDMMAGHIGTISCTSFFPSKPLGCYGDGGACFTDDDNLAEKIRTIANHGQTARYQHTYLGVNSRLDTLQAAVLTEKLAIFPEEAQLRQTVAQRYANLLANTNIIPQQLAPRQKSVYAQYTIRVNNRAAIQQALNQHGIPTAIHYPKPLHLQPVFATLGYQPGDFPHSEQAAETVLSLPMHPYLTETQQQAIVEVLINAHETNQRCSLTSAQ